MRSAPDALWACLLALRRPVAEEVAVSQPSVAASEPAPVADDVSSSSTDSIRAVQRRLYAMGPIEAWRSIPRAWKRQAHTRAARERTGRSINPKGASTLTECVVCLCESRHLVAFGPCGHKFHDACLQRWAAARRAGDDPEASCPTCRSKTEWARAAPLAPTPPTPSRSLRRTWEEASFVQDLGGGVEDENEHATRHGVSSSQVVISHALDCRVEYEGPRDARRLTRITCDRTGVVELYTGSAGHERLIRTIDHTTIETYAGEMGMEFRTSMETGGFIHYYSGPEETLVRVADATTGQSLYSEMTSHSRFRAPSPTPRGPVRDAEMHGHRAPSVSMVSVMSV
jgi:hypothetical protein